MGPMHCKILGIVQYFNLFLTAIAYNITGGVSMQDFAETYCGEEGGCFSTYWIFCVIFAVVQLVLSQLPNMDSLWWMSGIGTLMAFFYSIITLALSISVGNTHGTWDGIPNTPEKRMWSAFNAIGAIVFAFSFSFILVEIADTIRSDKRGIVYHAKKATDISMIIISGFYIAVSVAGYMAFGNSVCNNVISCFDHPAWVIRMTALFVLIHMLSAYQVFSQPVFYLTETTVGKKFNKYGAWAFRFTFRCAYVAFVAFVSICLPFFSDIVGLIGAIGFWPATIYYPVEMYILNNNPSRKKVIALQILNAFCCIVTILAVAGSIQLIIASSATYKLF
ncbi:transmembrane amino acid transporter protein [Helicosporidium sp. ATCC 50920]|nr:transmembrane amino acid transporter protein [Helicosporidium sp. ATCC 50920]|eukprot:KDD74181.1 transmembrane amino acid transporter protein [Helicosporidium sp. ATCC 50920]